MNGGPVKIVLKYDVSLYCVKTAGRILCLPKVTKEMNRMKNEGIMEKLT